MEKNVTLQENEWTTDTVICYILNRKYTYKNTCIQDTSYKHMLEKSNNLYNHIIKIFRTPSKTNFYPIYVYKWLLFVRCTRCRQRFFEQL